MSATPTDDDDARFARAGREAAVAHRHRDLLRMVLAVVSIEDEARVAGALGIEWSERDRRSVLARALAHLGPELLDEPLEFATASIRRAHRLEAAGVLAARVAESQVSNRRWSLRRSSNRGRAAVRELEQLIVRRWTTIGVLRSEPPLPSTRSLRARRVRRPRRPRAGRAAADRRHDEVQVLLATTA